jgi:hypothetical protein
MPTEAHLDAVWDAAGVWADPRLVRTEGNPNPTRPVMGFVACCLTNVKVPSMSSHE